MKDNIDKLIAQSREANSPKNRALAAQKAVKSLEFKKITPNAKEGKWTLDTEVFAVEDFTDPDFLADPELRKRLEMYNEVATLTTTLRYPDEDRERVQPVIQKIISTVRGYGGKLDQARDPHSRLFDYPNFEEHIHDRKVHTSYGMKFDFIRSRQERPKTS